MLLLYSTNWGEKKRDMKANYMNGVCVFVFLTERGQNESNLHRMAHSRHDLNFLGRGHT